MNLMQTNHFDIKKFFKFNFDMGADLEWQFVKGFHLRTGISYLNIVSGPHIIDVNLYLDTWQERIYLAATVNLAGVDTDYQSTDAVRLGGALNILELGVDVYQGIGTFVKLSKNDQWRYGFSYVYDLERIYHRLGSINLEVGHSPYILANKGEKFEGDYFFSLGLGFK